MVASSLSTLIAAACGTLVGAGVSAAGLTAATGNDMGNLIGAGVDALDGAIDDITRAENTKGPGVVGEMRAGIVAHGLELVEQERSRRNHAVLRACFPSRGCYRRCAWLSRRGGDCGTDLVASVSDWDRTARDPSSHGAPSPTGAVMNVWVYSTDG